MQKSLFLKLLGIGFLALLLLLPLSMISQVITERSYTRDGVIADIASSSTGNQMISGVIFAAPYKEKVTREVDIFEDGKRETVTKEEIVNRVKYFLPDSLNVDGMITTEERYRGIYKVPVYNAEMKLDGEFTVPAYYDVTENRENITWGKPYILLGISDIRGINRSLRMKIDGKEQEVLPGSQTSFLPQGVHVPMPANHVTGQSFSFNVDLSLNGMQSISFLPTGKYTKITLDSPWPHPSFYGRYLPKDREVSEQGFSATWETSFFATNMLHHLTNCSQFAVCDEFNDNLLGVSLHEGVDIYLQAERSIKYSLLFVGLTFIVFFLFEVLKGLKVHVVQYSLVGVALAFFYLLLISLSEHIAFVHAYLIASAACVGLLGFYVSYVLRSILRGMVFGGTLVGLYGSLYMLIRSEDFALLMGSGLLFGILAFIMVITRNVDWYKIEVSTKSKSKQVKADGKEETPSCNA